jgi:hypothetical protein
MLESLETGHCQQVENEHSVPEGITQNEHMVQKVEHLQLLVLSMI